ncbi:putative O-linked N-acetylglucosamine transferase, SPINDLY family [Opitutaceae bacterium TAV1]|nr:putative O-linked N-acetylglucosamine transferase, SPINDLY family [Opitutaceae bacterium TAV1]
MAVPGKLQSLLAEAHSQLQAGRLARAEALCRQLVALAPREVLVLGLAGRVALRRQRLPEAIALLGSALRLAPGSVSIAVRLASALLAAGRAAEAETMLRNVTRLTPDSAAGWNTLAFVLKVRGRPAEAVPAHERATTLDSGSADAWTHYGLTLSTLGKNFQALRCHDRALAADPGFAMARFGRAQALHKINRIDEALADYEAYLKSGPPRDSALQARSYRLFALQNSDLLSNEERFAEHLAYGRELGGAAGKSSVTGRDGRDLHPEKRPLRLAILSPDLRTHSCAYFLEPVLRHLDPAQFELLLYHDHLVEDEISARFRRLARTWRNFVARPDAEVERIVREDRPDILVDLSGHIGMTIRLPLFARRLAPVQVTWLGYPDTTGTPGMDYRFTDAIADPPGDADRFHTEKLVRFAPVAWTWQPPADAPAVAPPPCLAGGSVTFGCFNSPTKFTDSQFALWARILAAVPASRLLLKGAGLEEAPVRELLLARLQRAGLPADRVELLPRTDDTASHLALYRRVDIALDTFPYNGTTTTCEALWMGRPVITLAGNRHAARVSASLLAAIGCPEWIASCQEDYVARAIGLASRPAALAAITAALRARMLASPLLDHAGQGARFAAALRACWRECAAASPPVA